MLDTITIREVPPDRPDVLALIEALDAYYYRIYPIEVIHVLDIDGLLRPDVFFLAAEVNHRAVGCGGFLRDGDFAEIKRMYVDPAWRGQGIGSRLLAALEAQIHREGFRVIRLETGDRQPEALCMYERMGYSPTPPFVEYMDDPHSVFYAKRLGEE